jgi:hypothetical protein
VDSFHGMHTDQNVVRSLYYRTSDLGQLENLRKQLRGQQLQERVFAIIHSSLIVFEKRDDVRIARKFSDEFSISSLRGMKRATPQPPIKNRALLVSAKVDISIPVDKSSRDRRHKPSATELQVLRGS